MKSLDNDTEKSWNIYMIVISYFINNCISGIVYDVYINYLQETSIDVAKSFWSYYGYSMFLSAFLITIINKVGYKKTLFLSVGGCSLGLFGTFLASNSFFTKFSVLLLLNGIQLHYLILLPYISKYTRAEEQVKWFSRVYYTGYIGFFLLTYLGGYMTIKIFTKKIGISFEQAKQLTNNVEKMSEFIRENYIKSMEELILILGIVSILGIVPIILIKEKKSDYISSNERKNKGIIQTIMIERKEIFNRDSILYCFYWGLNNFAIGLFVPYYTIYLNRILNIDKVSTSFIISLSYVAVVVFVFFTDKIVQKIGKIKTLYTSILMALPFMLIIAEGEKIETNRVLIIGVALFLRTGIMNLGGPIDSSLAVEVIKKDMIPAYTGVISCITGFAGIFSGYFTGAFLFNLENGYKLGYYIGAFLYFIGALILIFNFSKLDKIKLKEKL